MRTITAVIMLCFIIVSASFAAPALNSAAANAMKANISTVTQLQKLKGKSQPVKVMSGQLDNKIWTQIRSQITPSAVDAMSNSLASQAYKNGSGVILKPANMADPTTGSWLSLTGVLLGKDAVNNIIAKNDAPVNIMCPAGPNNFLGFLVAKFVSLPTGSHTYMLTLSANMQTGTQQRLLISAGNSSFDRDHIAASGNLYRVMFTFDPSQSADKELVVMAMIRFDAPDALAFLDFSYLQLAQID